MRYLKNNAIIQIKSAGAVRTTAVLADLCCSNHQIIIRILCQIMAADKSPANELIS